MLDLRNNIEQSESTTIYIEKSSWIRAQCSGLLHDNGCIGRYVEKVLFCYHYGSFGAFERKVNAPNDGYIINANLSPIVYQGMLYTT
jgi:predicted deacylase